ncbi:MAG: GspE/PulE family protein [Phycisphaerales bacterium]
MSVESVLLGRGVVTPEQAEEGRRASAGSTERIDQALIRLGHTTREAVLAAFAAEFHMPVVDLEEIAPEPEVIDLLPAALVYRQKCVPIARQNGTLTVATSDPFEIAAHDELQLVTGCSIDLVLADEAELERFMRRHYGVGGDTLDAMAKDDAPVAESSDAAEEIERAQEASVIKLVNDLLTEAVSERATDVHIEPYEHELTVRYRIDGVLQRASVPPTIHRYGAAIVSRIKIMSSLNIAEKRRPQDGRISFSTRLNGRIHDFDMRVSVIPMLFGEGVVLRVLDNSAALMSLDDLGMDGDTLVRWDKLISKPHGIVLVTGPTGSGKSTTLYASLNRIVTDEIKAVTIEDPVEYHASGVNQIQVNTKTGLTFAAGLRSVLRHDPDVVMVGEIRDKETAETAIQASLTGHLVFSTLHTNDAAGAPTRLLDMGVEPFLVSSSVEGVLAQRLVRRICPDHFEEYTPDQSDLPRDFALPASGTLRRGVPDRANRNTGYRGRLGVFELLTLSHEIREMIMARANAPELAKAAIASDDLRPIRADGYEKVRAGRTTLSELARALAV